jgi:hypothetical protein
MSTGPEHFLRAEQLLAQADRLQAKLDTNGRFYLGNVTLIASIRTAAQAEATLALTAAAVSRNKSATEATVWDAVIFS